MKAVVVHKYGGPEELKFEEFPDPVPAAGEVLVRVAATSINPFDIMRRSGAVKDAAVQPWIAFACYVIVAVMWLLPDPRIEKTIGQ